MHAAKRVTFKIEVLQSVHMKHRMYESGWILNEKRKKNSTGEKKLDFYAYDWMGACNNETVKKNSAFHASQPSTYILLLYRASVFHSVCLCVCACGNIQLLRHTIHTIHSIIFNSKWKHWFQGNHNGICNFLIKLASLAIKWKIATQQNEINQHFKTALYINGTCRMPHAAIG